jgi:hypothetical protein
MLVAQRGGRLGSARDNRMALPQSPLLYQVNTRPFLVDLGRRLGRKATLDDIPDEAIERWAKQGLQWIWLLSVWQTGELSRSVSRTHPAWRASFEAVLPDLTDDDIPGSGFAITRYEVHESLGGSAALARLRDRLKGHDLKLMLDFVPNHTALDHDWVRQHPEYYVAGDESLLAEQPANYIRLPGEEGGRILALGRDPYFPGWPDALQLDYSNPDVRDAMAKELVSISRQCDGVRCDMAMLILPDVFERTWGTRPADFWPEAIQNVKQRHPDFVFMAEVYWDLEWTLQQHGFDYTYDKRLYDRLRERNTSSIRGHLRADMAFQKRLARFLENHDEPRAAATFAPGQHEAAAVITFLAPGLRFFQDGQFEGRRVHLSPHLGRAPAEPVQSSLMDFYQTLLDVLRRPLFHSGHWQLLDCQPAWDGNWTHDAFIAYRWMGEEGEGALVVVNYSDHQSQCLIRLADLVATIRVWTLADLLGSEVYQRAGAEMAASGLFIDASPWQASVFWMEPAGSELGCQGAPMFPSFSDNGGAPPGDPGLDFKKG